MNDRIVFWFITPPNNMKSIIEFFCSNWKGSIRLISLNDVTEERKKVGWNSSINSNVPLEILVHYNDPEAYAVKVLNDEIHAIHVFCGISKGPGKYLRMYNHMTGKNGLAFVISEPKTLVGSRIKRTIKRLFGSCYYIYERISVEKCIKGLFITGCAGIRQHIKYGWDEAHIFNFMYTPYYSKQIEGLQFHADNLKTNEIRFLYVGRFNYYTRGLDTLMKAVDALSMENAWKLTLVGGYGENADQVIEWAKKNNRVEFVGSWNPDTVSQHMRDYDVYICPSKIDGWNTQINEALLANIGVITTDAAGSDELITSSKAGIVIHKGDSEALRKAMQLCIDNPSEVEKWKIRAHQYINCIHPNVVSKYMIECIRYTLGDIDNMPKCPWIK